ncbi:hypothetical protein RvY_13314 [Ramazzottius varieornatus]|uniref:Uncharacterized protein n=1 Tax=Ramazzottius varieornatus TaxID=947166 RepID=A0A1D1VPA9_RAMVA|nr:hypothetical protein RvY_13314 [Ramazzottius varieornatus]
MLGFLVRRDENSRAFSCNLWDHLYTFNGERRIFAAYNSENDQSGHDGEPGAPTSAGTN